MRNILFFIMSIGLLFAVSCNEDDPVVTIDQQEQEQIEAFIQELGVGADSIATDTSGVYAYIRELNPGGKTQAEGNVLSIYYRLSTIDGQVIDVFDSLDGEPLVLKQGVSAIYPIGIDYSLAYMKEGEKWGFVIPSRIAYGALSYSTLIPENAILHIEIDLIEIRSEDDVLNEELSAMNDYVVDNNLSDTVTNPLNRPEYLPNGIIYKRLRAGTSGTQPSLDQTVTVTYEGRFLDNEVFDRAPNAAAFSFVMGAGVVIPGFEFGVERMEVGERALFIMPSFLAYRESAVVIPDISAFEELLVENEIIPTYVLKVGPYRPVIFEIDLIGVN